MYAARAAPAHLAHGLAGLASWWRAAPAGENAWNSAYLAGQASRRRCADHTRPRRAAMIFTNDRPRISSVDSPVASASCSVTAPHAMPRKK